MKKNLTEFYVYNAMIYFLYGYEKRRYGYGTLQKILRELSLLPEGGTSNPAIWAEWKRCVSKSLEEILETEPSGQVAHRVYTKLQAFNAMVNFFIDYYKRTLSGDLRILMEVVCSLAESSTDQAAWSDWNNAAKKALQKRVFEKPEDETMERRLTKSQTFKAMVQLFKNYFEPDPDNPDAVMFFDYLHLLPDGNSSGSSAIREKWKICVNSALKEKPGMRKYRIFCRG